MAFGGVTISNEHCSAGLDIVITERIAESEASRADAVAIAASSPLANGSQFKRLSQTCRKPGGTGTPYGGICANTSTLGTVLTKFTLTEATSSYLGNTFWSNSSDPTGEKQSMTTGRLVPGRKSNVTLLVASRLGTASSSTARSLMTMTDRPKDLEETRRRRTESSSMISLTQS